MNKKEFSEKIMKVLEERKIPNREKFNSKAFMYPSDPTDGELTIIGAQFIVVLAQQADLNYKFYKIDEENLKTQSRNEIIKQIKSQYPEIIFFICDLNNENEARTIDTENNMLVFDNESFDAAVDLCGGIDAYIKTMLS